jgi:deoxycytidylate deaminase
MNTMIASWKRGFSVAKVAKVHSNGQRLGEKMGAALFSGPILVSIGYNTYDKTHPEAKNRRFTRCVHAEHQALLKRRYSDDKDLTMYVYREKYGPHGIIKEGNSRPCESCMRIMKLAGVKAVRFFDEQGPGEIRL